jgi:hypothetical protein
MKVTKYVEMKELGAFLSLYMLNGCAHQNRSLPLSAMHICMCSGMKSDMVYMPSLLLNLPVISNAQWIW